MSSCNNIEFIDWSNFKNIKTIENGVLPNRLCCIIVEYNGDKKILKEMDKNMNYGLDYMIIDKCKHIFGLNHMNMIQIKSNKGLVKIDKTSKTYVDNNKIDDNIAALVTPMTSPRILITPKIAHCNLAFLELN